MTSSSTEPAFHPPASIDWQDLIATGRAILVPQSSGAQPTPAAIRRAVSTAYYAALHALNASNVEVLIGPAHNQLTADAWMQIYRGLSHRQARTQLQQHRDRLSADAKIFADVFRDLQNERHNADYNPRAAFTIQAATNLLNQAEAAITDFLRTGQSERVAIATLTLFRTR